MPNIPFPIEQTGRLYKDDNGKFTVYQECWGGSPAAPKSKKKAKGNIHYKTGYRLERDVKIALEQEGYTVFRSAGSHSKADLIAIGLDITSNGIRVPTVRLVQCKRHKNLMTRKEIKDFYDFADELACVAMIAWRDKGVHLEEIRE